MDWNILSFMIQLAIFGTVIAIIVHRKKKASGGAPSRPVRTAQSNMELQKLIAMRSKRLNEPLSESVRPNRFSDIIGQDEGIRALRAALCGPNPQHVLIFGPPGVGKTCAARLVLEEAKARKDSPFNEDSKFVEVDATCVRFDERAIADPLMGSVHDPIYQGAGSLGTQGVPQPKPGAVSRAHCGILFLDEIGELHPMQMNKLLKVLEDRSVKFESAYYSSDNANIPQHIHDIFQNGLPADFRLVGATTRRPEELPPALRSRCLELYFRELGQPELERIALGAVRRAGYEIDGGALHAAALHAHSGRDAVNIVQLCCGLAYDAGRREVKLEDVDWVVRTCNYAPRMEQRMPKAPRIGCASGLAVAGSGTGLVLEIECLAVPVKTDRPGRLTLNGVVEEEELDLRDRKLRRKSMAMGSVENVLAAFSTALEYDLSGYDVRFNIPGGVPMDGPSAGIALAIALFSALTRQCAEHLTAATGEITITGDVRPVGGVREKLEAAVNAGARRVLIPADNWEEDFAGLPILVQPVKRLQEVLSLSFLSGGVFPGAWQEPAVAQPISQPEPAYAALIE